MTNRLSRPHAAVALAGLFLSAATLAQDQPSKPPAPEPAKPSAPVAAPAPTQLDCRELPSALLGRSVGYCVCLPSDYASSPSRRYPVLYFLHGLFEGDEAWGERGGKEVLDRMLAAGQLGPFIVVLPDGGRTFYVNSSDGKVRYEDFFIGELVPAIDRLYRTLPERQARGISGVSMGGYGALHLAMRHPDVFGAASAHSAALLPKFPNPLPSEGRWGFYARVLEQAFGNPLSEAWFDQNNPLTLAEHPESFANLKLYFDCGNQDRYGFDAGARLFDQILTQHGFPHEYALREGTHGWGYMHDYEHYSLEFHWKYFQQAEQAAAASKGAAGRAAGAAKAPSR